MTTAPASRRELTGAGRRLLAGVIAIGMLAVAGTWSNASAGASTSAGARLVNQMRTAAGQTDFSGVVEVTWRTASGKRQQATVEVHSVDGVLEVSADGHVVLDDDGQTFVKDELGWSSTPAQPDPQHRPAPDARWALTVRPSTAQHRPATTVVASRPDGSVAQRLVIDDATHLLLERQVVARDGTVERAFRFASLDLDPVAAAAGIAASPTTPARTAKPLETVPDGYRAPDRSGAGYVLVSQAAHAGGVQLVYTDGLFSMSVLEQRGELDWDGLPKGGTDTTVDGARARRYSQPMGTVMVWERDGVVFTCASDAPDDVLTASLAGLRADPSTAEQVVDFVLGPFGFD
ncbi:MAG TPA: hypothetical protein VFZ17_00785 [Acidimicrobiia bacterium]|nr:hypothetical protein [Acidimicrobiia bacterium]